jgi:peptidoglycan lytic transglycosylase
VGNLFRHFRPAVSLVFGLFLIFGVVPAGAATAEADGQAVAEKQLESLARSLKDKNTVAAYLRLSAFAKRRSSGVWGQRAALALGYYDYGRGHFAEARRWLDRALGDALLKEYALFWSAQVNRSLGKNREALEELENFRREYPDSVMADQALQALAETALALNEPESALVALGAGDSVASKPALLFLRGQAQEKMGHLDAAAADYAGVYYRHPLSASAPDAKDKMRSLARSLGDKFPATPLPVQLARAGALFAAHRWSDARQEYEALRPKLTEYDRLLANLRIAQCRSALTKSPAPLAAFTLSDPQLDAERLYFLSQAYRAQKLEPEMLAAIEQTVSRLPQSRWAEQALFAGGNYYWVLLDLERAGQFYRRVLDQFPDGPDAVLAHWRVAWQAYREHRPDAAALLEQHVRRFPASPHLSDALYWLGRTAQQAGNAELARAYFGKLHDRYPQTYFGVQAAARLRELGFGPAASVELLTLIPPPPAIALLDEPVPPSAEERRQRARALHVIAFDASEEQEYRAAYAATGAPRLLLEAARAAGEASRYGAAIVAIRLLFPQFEAHPIDDIPMDVWREAYPLPYRSEMHHWAARAGLDPMLVAGLIRQESAFAPEAISPAGAIGLMQLEPSTARKLARQLHVRYARARLSNPEYNLRLGTHYFAWLRSTLGSVEAALAAYNAGEDRVAAWEDGRTYAEPAEFVESIPFTETRDYVQIVMRNSAMYRALYGGGR